MNINIYIYVYIYIHRVINPNPKNECYSATLTRNIVIPTPCNWDVWAGETLPELRTSGHLGCSPPDPKPISWLGIIRVDV